MTDIKIFPLSKNWQESAQMLYDGDLRGSFLHSAKVVSTALGRLSDFSPWETCEFDEVCEWACESPKNVYCLISYLNGIIREYEIRYAKSFETADWRKIVLSFLSEYIKLDNLDAKETPFPILFDSEEKDVVKAYKSYYLNRTGHHSMFAEMNWRQKENKKYV